MGRRVPEQRWNRLRRSTVERLECRLVLDSTVVFNEIMYNPAGETDASLEWVELYNQMAVDMDLSGWSIEGGVNYNFAEGTILGGKEFLLVAIDPVAFEAEHGVLLAGVLGPFTGQLSNQGEELRLVNNTGRRMSVVNYEDAGEWLVGADGSGASLAKTDENANSELYQNWRASATNHN